MRIQQKQSKTWEKLNKSNFFLVFQRSLWFEVKKLSILMKNRSKKGVKNLGTGVINHEKNIANVVVKGNPRIQMMKDHLFKEKRQISLERALLYTESYRQTEGEPTIIRRAKAVAHILEKVEISIREGELLVGNRTVRPRSGILSPEMDPYWIMQEIDTIASRPQDQFEFTEADKKSIGKSYILIGKNVR